MSSDLWNLFVAYVSFKLVDRREHSIVAWLKFRNTTSSGCKSISKAFTYILKGIANNDVYILNMQKQSITKLIEFLAASSIAAATPWWGLYIPAQ